MRRPGIILALVAALILAAPPPAHADQLSASDSPATSGDLTRTLADCASKVDRTAGGLTRARVKICGYSFVLNPDSESDANNNYGVLWVQSHVAPRNDFCVEKTHTNMRFSDDVPIHSRSPRGRVLEERDPVRVRIRADAQGAVDEGSLGVVRNRFVMYPGSLRRRTIQDSGQRTVRLTWDGETGRKVGFASGVEVAWPGNQTLPPSFVYNLRVRMGGRNC